jgi:hypothetical protein
MRSAMFWSTGGYQCTMARLLCTIVVFSIKAGEDIATRTGPSINLHEERGEEVATMLLVKVPEVKIKVRLLPVRLNLPRVAVRFLRTRGKVSYLRMCRCWAATDQRMLFRSRLRIKTVMEAMRRRVGMAYARRRPTRENQRTPTLQTYWFERTIEPFPHGECRTRCCGSLMDLAE